MVKCRWSDGFLHLERGRVDRSTPDLQTLPRSSWKASLNLDEELVKRLDTLFLVFLHYLCYMLFMIPQLWPSLISSVVSWILSTCENKYKGSHGSLNCFYVRERKRKLIAEVSFCLISRKIVEHYLNLIVWGDILFKGFFRYVFLLFDGDILTVWILLQQLHLIWIWIVNLCLDAYCLWTPPMQALQGNKSNPP